MQTIRNDIATIKSHHFDTAHQGFHPWHTPSHVHSKTQILEDSHRFFDFDAACEESSRPRATDRVHNRGNVISPENSSETESEHSDGDENEESDDDDSVNAARDRYYDECLWDPSLLQFRPEAVQECLTTAVGDEERAVHGIIAQEGIYYVPEKCGINQSAAEMLASVHQCLSSPISIPLPGSPLRHLKVEEPVLCSDMELELLKARKNDTTRVSGEKMLPFVLDDEEDETLKWSKSTTEAARKIAEDAGSARLGIGDDAAKLIREVVHTFEQPDLNIWASKPRSKLAVLKISPALLPLSSSPSLPELLPSAAEIELTSTPDDLLGREAAELHDHIMAKDAGDGPTESEEKSSTTTQQRKLEVDDAELAQFLEIIANEGPDADFGSIVRDQDETNPFEEYIKMFDGSPHLPDSEPMMRTEVKSLQTLKLPSPVLPLEYSSGEDEDDTHLGKRRKTVHLPEDLKEVMQDAVADLQPAQDFVMGRDTAELQLTECLQHLAAPALEQLSNENLSELDVVLRLPVPVVTAIESKVPWTSSGPLLAEAKAEMLMNEAKWSGLSAIERKLTWSVFPSRLGKPRPEGDFDDGSLTRYLAELALDEEDSLDPYIWKPDGLSILQIEEDDIEELKPLEWPSADEEADFPTQNGEALSQNPPKHLQNEKELGTGDVKLPIKLQQEDPDWSTILEKRRNQLKVADKDATESLMPTSAASGQIRHSDSFRKFLQVRGKHALMPTESSTAGQHPDVGKAQESRAHNAAQQHSVSQKPPLIVLPSLDQPDRRFPVVTSLALASHRPIIRRLNFLLPQLDLIERPVIDAAPGDLSGPPDRLSREADLTIAPGVGITLTTLPKLHQRSLPGQEASSKLVGLPGLQERLVRVAPRYETLIVLVSEGSADDHMDEDGNIHGDHIRTLDTRDAAVLAALIPPDVADVTTAILRYIPGGPLTLAHWVAACICRHSLATASNVDARDPGVLSQVTWIHDETLWERFLRAAGLNAYAAQVILSRLPRVENGQTAEGQMVESEDTSLPTVTPSRRSKVTGLAAFVTMTAAERLRLFGPIMGGSRVLERVNRALAGPGWTSRAVKG